MIIKRIHLTGNSNISYWGILIWGMALMFSCQEKEFNTFTPVGSGTPHTDILDILQRGSFETDAFITEWTVPAATTIVLPLDSAYSYNFIVDWGDDSDLSQVVAFNDPNARHTYINSGIYTVRILGTCEAWRWDRSTHPIECRQFLTKIIQWGNVHAKNFEESFAACIALSSIPAGIPNMENFNNTFYGCESLTTLPSGLFSKCVNTTSFSNTFSHCTSLRSLPQDLFNACTAVTEFNGTFYTTGLVYIPEKLFDNCQNITSFQNTFGNCKNITNIPIGLFDKNENVISFLQTFAFCDNLKTIPLRLFDKCKKATDFMLTFYLCFNLTGETPKTNGIELWERAGLIGYPTTINGLICFYGCTNLTNYNSIPTNWK